MVLKLGMHHLGLKLYKVCINGDPGLTLTYFTARSNGNLGFSIGKSKTVDVSETITACGLKNGRCRQMIKVMNVCEY